MSRRTKYDHYKLLEVPNWATSTQIRSAYRRKVKFCHPDMNPSPLAGEVFRAVNQAYLVLIDPDQREKYDHLLRFHRPAKHSSLQRKEAGPQEFSTPDVLVHPFLFYGIHLVGLLFALAMIIRTIFGFTMEDWPFYMAIFIIPGIAILPDSVMGLVRP